jgi:uncharacterized protein
MGTEVADNPEEQRYEVLVDGHLAGVIKYSLDGKRITLWHTETELEYAGRGLASQLARVALDDIKQRELELVPLCPFIAKFVRQHPDEYLDTVAADYRTKVLAEG